MGIYFKIPSWPLVKAMQRAQDHMKTGERILGDKEFI